MIEPLKGPWGLGGALAIGLTLLVVSMQRRAHGKPEIRPTDLALLLLPFLTWLLMSGQITKLGFAGVEVEVRQAILSAADASVEDQVTTVEGVLTELDAVSRGAKGAPNLIQQYLDRQVEALEFRLGRGSYYVGSVIQEYLDALVPQPFFRFVVVFDEAGGLFGLVRGRDVVAELERRRHSRLRTLPLEESYDELAKILNDGGETAQAALRAIPGFIGGELALTPSASKREALAAMEAAGLPLLPVVDPNRALLGVVERDRLTASLLLDISRSLEEGP